MMRPLSSEIQELWYECMYLCMCTCSDVCCVNVRYKQCSMNVCTLLMNGLKYRTSAPPRGEVISSC